MSPPPPQSNSTTSNRPRATVLGVLVDVLDRDAVVRRAVELMTGPRPALLITANALLALDVSEDAALDEACRSAELVVADGVGLVWAAARLRQPQLQRLPGIDLALDLCTEAARMGAPVFLLGAAPGVASQAAELLKRSVPGINIAGVQDGFFTPETEASALGVIAASGARLILVALGSPKQEVWVHSHREKLPAALYLGVGGSFDVWSGRLHRAPALVRKLGLEWLFRLLQEPARYDRMLGLPIFAWRVEQARRRSK